MQLIKSKTCSRLLTISLILHCRIEESGAKHVVKHAPPSNPHGSAEGMENGGKSLTEEHARLSHRKVHRRKAFGLMYHHAMGRLSIAVALAIAVMTFATPTSAHTPPVATRQYAIAPNSLRDALDALATQSDVQIIYSPELVTGKTTQGISGRYTAANALKLLLAGTQLSWSAINESTIVLRPAVLPNKGTRIAAAQNVRNVVRTLETVSVSGSLIGNTQIQTATPTYTISSEAIQASGFNSLAEVLQNSVLATGSVQGQQTTGSFTQGAQAVSLFGLGPGFTSILIDGKPVANFGRLYNGSSNFNNISNIPISMIDHIDVMPGGSSTIYGSQAVAGVINIVTRQRMDGGEVSLRTGNFSDGGGASQRMSFAYGHDFQKLNLLAMFEFDNASPIWGYQRALTAGTHANPDGMATPTVQSGILDYGTANTFTGSAMGFLDPPAGCDNRLFGGSTTLTGANASLGYGHYCGSQNVDGYTTYSNQSRSYNGMLKLKYDVNDKLRLYSDVLLNWQQQKWFSGVPGWFPDDLPGGAIEDASTGSILYPEKRFAPEEMPGGVAGQMSRQEDVLYQADIGANGQFGESDWDWDVYYLRTSDRTEVVERLSTTAGIDGFFDSILRPVGIDPDSGIALYHPNYAAFFQPVTPAQYASFTQGIGEISNTWINNTRATISDTHLFSLPGGEASIAVLAEGGNEAWYEPLNPLFADGDIYEHATTGGGGRRSHLASAFELNLPLLKQLTLDLSGRYDHYSLDEGSSNSKFTYKAGIEYRPLDSLLLRGNYTTAFKAPDLSAIYLGPSSYYTQVTDYYLCTEAHSTNCDNYTNNVFGEARANRTLQPTTAKSWTVGAIWSPNNSISVSIDYLHDSVEDEVIAQDTDLLMREDAQCLLGQLNPNSTECQAITNPTNGQVQRAGQDGQGAALGPITGITTYYANLANEVIDSLIVSGKYQFVPVHFGKFYLQLDYSDMLKHDYQLAPGQLPMNQLADPLYSAGFKSVVGGTLGWSSLSGRWKSALYGHRYGSSPNYTATNDGAAYPGSGRIHPWVTFNWSLMYAATSNVDLSVLVNNVANKMPPKDPTYTSYPYFNVENYNAYGREIMLQAELKFGGKTH
nr:TonB-dependent receptor [Rhodanobacter sp. MP1X3]